MSDTKNLTLLGSANTNYPNEYTSNILERFENQFPKNDYVVEIECPEFTSMCPKTGQPDFASILIKYIPDNYLVESKSLKLYLFSFRNKGEFHEDCINTIAQDLFNLMQPKWLEIRGDFLPRGGISINPTVTLRK